jgi:hypothetical protein
MFRVHWGILDLLSLLRLRTMKVSCYGGEGRCRLFLLLSLVHKGSPCPPINLLSEHRSLTPILTDSRLNMMHSLLLFWLSRAEEWRHYALDV